MAPFVSGGYMFGNYASLGDFYVWFSATVTEAPCGGLVTRAIAYAKASGTDERESPAGVKLVCPAEQGAS